MAQSIFKSKEEEHEEPALTPRKVPGGNDDIGDYRKVPLKDCGNDEVWNGQPFIANIYEGTDKKTKQPYYSAAFIIYDHETREALRGNIYLKGMEDDIKLKKGSLGYELVKSIDKVKGFPTKDNVIIMKFSELQGYIYNLNAIKAVIKEQWNDAMTRTWNTIEITELIEAPKEG
ncbi:hypothetical protein [Methanobacterium spitsbergense]|uniref:Uncharacterized protein n=1 Tax=Methanobacterium spitsbergense TaxID=2874285 RepID=A0A8T5UTE8_9EURY|nr:hypothetical protein [Methanobacterium spitsbergense]MBZ2166984.1 hypothetical protein [Methanobacterium spitsbergense]